MVIGSGEARAVDRLIARASRLCDRLVAKGLVNRADDPVDRRQLTLTLTPAGERVVDTVMRRRRQVIEPMLARMRQRMTGRRRAEMVSVLRDFAAAGGEPSDPGLWAKSWTT